MQCTLWDFLFTDLAKSILIYSLLKENKIHKKGEWFIPMCWKVKRQSSCSELMCQCSCIQCSLDVLSNCLCIYYFEFDCLSFPDYRPVNTTLIINTGDRSVILNQTFTITCDTQANPPATYEIFRDDGHKVGSNSVVTSSVTEVEGNNSVTFTCKVSNGYGDGPTAKITLEVYCKCNGFESVC